MDSRRNQIVHAGAIALSIVAFSACQQELPTAPSDLEAGIIVYEHADFMGESALITEDISDLRDFKGPCEHYDSSPYGSYYYDWNDCISSIRVAPGWRATIYRDPGYDDDSMEIAADVPNLQLAPHDCPKRGLNDCISSIRVRRQ